MCFDYENKVEKLDLALLFNRNLILELNNLNFLSKSIFITPKFRYEISPLGTKESARYSADRIALIGRFPYDCYRNNISIDNSYMKFSRNHLIIVSGSSGYYISDNSEMGRLALNLLNDIKLKIKEDNIIGLG